MEIKYPRNETPMLSYCKPGGTQMFLLTKKATASRILYCMYEVSADGSLKKLGQGDSPPELEEKYSVDEKIKAGTCKKASGKVK